MENYPNKILVIGTPRSGTTAMANAFVNDKQGRHRFGEIGNQKISFALDDKGLPTNVPVERKEFNREYYFTNTREKIEFVNRYSKWVVKYICNAHTHPYLNECFSAISGLINDAELIIYTRRNIVDTMISFNNSLETDVWNLTDKSAEHVMSKMEPKNVRFIIPPDELIKWYKYKKDLDEWAVNQENRFKKFHIIDYSDDLIKDNEGFFNSYLDNISSVVPKKLKEFDNYNEKVNIAYDERAVRDHIKKVLSGYKI